jgi:16S rRNA G966 N2-methylase RsmD
MQTKTYGDIFGSFDFKQIHNPNFKEDSVREVVILPLLTQLGYGQESIERSKNLLHPYLKIGSKKRPITLVPDYLLKVHENYALVLDAKAPTEKITEGDNVEQVYSYATHPEIRTTYFALCNGLEFALFRRELTDTPILHFYINEIEHYWEQLVNFLSPSSFQTGKDFTYEKVKFAAPTAAFDYNTRPLLAEIETKKQAAKRHFGVHGYFTKQSWNVVKEYIQNFSRPGDLVLDPFGGSGVTAVEAMMLDRRAIHIDLNPMSVFIVKSLIAPIKQSELTEAFLRVKATYQKHEPKTKEEIEKALTKYPYPKGFILPKGSDVGVIEELFSQKQLAQLAYLKHLIKKEKDENIKSTLLLAFSSSINKYNLTFHYTETDGGGDGSVFRYYRYRIAPKHDALELWNIFETKFKKVSNAKQEIQYKINAETITNAEILKGTATHLQNIKNETVDYIYTDPPYGKKIPYLDLSTMWNAWLDLKVTEQDFEDEAIEGGEHNKTKDEYNNLMAESITEMYRVLKYDRWLSFVFAHKDPEFWHLIVETAERCGFEYAGAVKQGNGQTSFKKRQNPFTVLAGQLIINFKKVKNPKAIMKANLGLDIAEIVMQTMEGIIAYFNGASLEQINDELIIKGLELGFLDLLKKEYSDLTPLLMDNFDYNDNTQIFTIRKNTKFKTHIDLNLRVRYYLISFLRRAEREKKYPTFDEIIFNIIPLLKNGITPEAQTVLKVLQDIGERTGDDRWKLKSGKLQTTLFD